MLKLISCFATKVSFGCKHPTPASTSTMPMNESNSVADLRERFQRLKEFEMKYQCLDYTIAASASRHRVEAVLEWRHKTLVQLYRLIRRHCIDQAVMSTAAFIFDRYLSTIMPAFIHGEEKAPFRSDLIGVASFFIAAKSLMSSHHIHRLEEIFRGYSREVFAEGVEWKILKALNWDVVYHPPSSIVSDILALLPHPRGYQYYDLSFEAYLGGIWSKASHLTKLASVIYGFIVDFSPSTIALAALAIAIERQPTYVNTAGFILVSPIEYFKTSIEQQMMVCSAERGCSTITRIDRSRLNLRSNLLGTVPS